MANNIWSEIKRQTRITEEDLMTEPVVYEPKKANNIIPPGSIAFDLETGSVDEMFKTKDPNFVRLTGYGVDEGEVFTTTLHSWLVEGFDRYDGWVIGHNILNFDCILLNRFYNLDFLKLAREDRLRDTKLLAFLADPPYSRTSLGETEKMYSLQTIGTQYLGIGKLHDLKELAKKFGGFDKIPIDDKEYNDYLVRDVEVTRDLCKVIEINDYAKREHKINAIASTISIEGFRVDIDLLEERIHEGEVKREDILTSLMGYGLPGPETSKAPHRTNKGLAAIDQAFKDLGVELPRTPKSETRPSTGKETLQAVIEATTNEDVTDLAEAILSLNGIRTIYSNIHDNLVDDRVHPKINLRQSSGRLSFTDPGLTTIGKKGGKVKERAVFLPDEGHVLISCDLSQIDARAVAGLSQDLEYIKLFDPGRDMHAEMAERLFGTRDKREQAKPVCVPLDYEILTKEGWKTWDQVEVGVDETLGLEEDGLLHWTPVLAVNHYDDVEVINLSTSSRFNVTCTPNHRWITDWRRGYNDGRPKYYTRTEREAKDIHSDDNLVLSAPADIGKGLPISNEEAELIGWILGDGSLTWSELKPSKSQGQNGERRLVNVCIHQSKPTWMNDIKRLTASANGTWTKSGPTFKSGFGGKYGAYVFRLSSPDSRDLLARTFGELPDNAGSKNDLDLIKFVLSLSPAQRNAFLDGFWKAEGHLEKGKRRVYTHSPGPILEAVELAVFLTGQLPSRTPHEGAARMKGTSARVTGQKMKKVPAGRTDVWCPTTGLGSWVMRKGHRLFLSLNSHGINYGMRPGKLSFTTGMSLHESEEVVRNFEKSFPVLTEWQRQIRIEGEVSGVLYNGFGRLMKIEPERSFTQSPALMGQSTARDLLCEGVLRLWEMAGDGIIKLIRGLVHDELLISCPIKDVEEIEQLVLKAMTFEWYPKGGKYPIMIEAGLGKRGQDWSRCYGK